MATPGGAAPGSGAAPNPGAARDSRTTPPARTWWQIRWRQFRNAPRPIVRAVASSLTVAIVLGVLYLTYDVALTRGAVLPGGDLRFAAATLDIVAVLVSGSVITWLIVPLPRGSGSRAVRTPWSAALGLFAAIPIAYLVLVVAVQVIEPLLV